MAGKSHKSAPLAALSSSELNTSAASLDASFLGDGGRKSLNASGIGKLFVGKGNPASAKKPAQGRMSILPGAGGGADK